MPRDNEPLEVLRLITSRLTEAGFVYAVTGPFAVTAYVQCPVSRDFDLVVRLRATDGEWICALFSRDFDLNPAAIEQAASGEGVATLVHRETGVRVRCHPLTAGGYQAQAFDRRRTMPLGAVDVTVAAPEDVVLFLLQASDDDEAASLNHAHTLLAHDLAMDERYLEEWSGHLGVSDRLRAARQG